MMKKFVFLFCVAVFFTTSSFRQDDGKDTGLFQATIDGTPFSLRDDQIYRGLLMKKSASQDGSMPSRTVISTIVHGGEYNISEEKLFSESIQFEIGYEDGKKPGVPDYYAVALLLKTGNYYMIKDQSKLIITSLEWESDKKYFRISVDYDCKMRSRTYADDGKTDVILKGRMENIRVTVPSWFTTKN